MGFTLSKIAGFFLTPSNVLLAMALLGLLLALTRLSRAGRLLTAGAVITLAVCGWSPLGQWLILPLEQRFPAWEGPAPDGIVVLGGAVDDSVSAARQAPALNEAAERMTAAVDLARRFPQARLVFSGGSGRLVRFGESESESAARLFAQLGLAPDRVIYENRSRNTAENARFSRDLIDPKPGERWLLVTSAYHMPRAVGLFRAAGFPVEAYPVDWRTRGPDDALYPFERVSEGLRRVDIAFREWVALTVYRIAGRSSSLLPGPDS